MNLPATQSSGSNLPAKKPGFILSDPPGGSYPAMEMTTRDYLKVIFRQKWVILLTVLTVALSAAVGLEIKTPVYEAQVKMLISAEKQVDSPYYRDIVMGRNIEPSLTQSEIVKSKPVLERTIASLGLAKRPIDYERHYASPLKQWILDAWMSNLDFRKLTIKAREAMVYRYTFENIKENIKVEPVRDTNLFLIKVRDFSPIGAAIIANTLSRSYVIFDLEQQYVDLQSKYTERNPIVIQLKENIKRMEAGLSGQPMPNIEALGPGSVKIIEQSTPPLKPIGLPKKVTLALAILMSIFLGIFMAFMFEYMDQSFHSKQDLESFLGVPVIACINKKKGFGHSRLVKDVSDANKSPRATSYRILAQQLHFMAKTKGIKSLVFSPVHPKEDVSAILANVGVYLSKRLGLRILLIDGDIRHPKLHRLFDVKNEQGLAQVLEEKYKIEEAVKNIGEKLDMVTAGRSLTDPAILIDTINFGKIISSIKPAYDVILVQGANLRDFRDSALLGPAVDGMIVVVSEGTVRRQVVRYSIKHLRDNYVRVLGTVMPNRKYLLPKFLYDSV